MPSRRCKCRQRHCSSEPSQITRYHRIEYFYDFDFDAEQNEATSQDSGRSDLLLSVRVYALADKYEVPRLKEFALEKFKQQIMIYDSAYPLLIAADAVYNEIQLPDSDRELRRVLVYIWTTNHHALKTLEHADNRALCFANGEFLYDVHMQLSLNVEWDAAQDNPCACRKCTVGCYLEW